MQFQLFSMEHARKGYLLRTMTATQCIETAKQTFGTSPVSVPFSMHFTPDKTQQYIICDGIVSMLPPSTTGRQFDSYTSPTDGRIYISDGAASFYPADVIAATREVTTDIRLASRKSALPGRLQIISAGVKTIRCSTVLASR